jgi:hypothetical protein
VSSYRITIPVVETKIFLIWFDLVRDAEGIPIPDSFVNGRHLDPAIGSPKAAMNPKL